MLTMTASARDLIPPPGPPNPPEEWYKEREESSPIIPPGVTPFSYTDCNHNGVADRSESFPDCDGNGIIDWCQIEADPSLDCDEDGLLDACLMSVNPGFDCNANGIFDLCEPQFQLPDYPLDPPQGALPDDCNANRISDELEICRNQLIDCNGNGLLDLCQILADPSLDCDGNGVLDFCEIKPRTDCDGNGILDRCENPCDIGLGGPRYLGDGDWGRWTWIEEAGCKVVVTVHSGPIKIVGRGSGYVDVQAYPMSPGDEQPAMLRAVMTCGGNCSVGSDNELAAAECFIDVPLTVQAYAVLKVEARAFIPCGAVALAVPSPPQGYQAFKGDCRYYDCETPLPTDTLAPSSRTVAGMEFTMRYRSTPPASIWQWAVNRPSIGALFTVTTHPSEWENCNGQPVANGTQLCNIDVLQWDNPCPVVQVASTPILTDLTLACGALAVQYVGAAHYKKVDLVLDASNSCVLMGPGINLEVELGLWQRCDPIAGMEHLRYALSGQHDRFPAVEIVFEEETQPGVFSRCCLYTCAPSASPEVGLSPINRVILPGGVGPVNYSMCPNPAVLPWGLPCQ
jgi:hypothetical protein